MPCKVGRQRGRGGQLLPYRTTQTRRLLRVALPERATGLANQTPNLTKDLIFGRPCLSSRGLLRLAGGGRLFTAMSFSVGQRRSFLLRRAKCAGARVFGRLLRGSPSRLFSDLPQMFRDDFLATIDRLLRTLLDSRVRLRGQRAPPTVEVFKRRGVEGVIGPMAVPLERRAERIDLARNCRRSALLGMQRVAFLLEDLVDV